MRLASPPPPGIPFPRLSCHHPNFNSNSNVDSKSSVASRGRAWNYSNDITECKRVKELQVSIILVGSESVRVSELLVPNGQATIDKGSGTGKKHEGSVSRAGEETLRAHGCGEKAYRT